MAQPPVIVIDGGMPYGTQIITASNGQSYTLDNFTVSRASTVATDNKNTGAPNRWRETAGFDTWSGTLQAPTTAAGYPKFGDTFSLTVDDNYGSELWTFSPVNYDASNDPSQIRKINVSGRKVYNGAVTTVNG